MLDERSHLYNGNFKKKILRLILVHVYIVYIQIYAYALLLFIIFTIYLTADLHLEGRENGAVRKRLIGDDGWLRGGLYIYTRLCVWVGGCSSDERKKMRLSWTEVSAL